MNPWTVLNFCLFYFGWFLCIWAVSLDLPFLGVATVVGVVGINLIMSQCVLKEVLVLLFFSFFGFFLDTFYQQLGILVFKSPDSFVYNGTPFWVLSLYLLMGTTINTSLGWLKHHPILCIPSGFLGASFSYRAGALLNVVTFPKGVVVAMFVIGMVWALFLPFTFQFAKKLDELFEEKKPDA